MFHEVGWRAYKKKSKDKLAVELSEQVEKKAKKSPLKLKGLYNKLASKGK